MAEVSLHPHARMEYEAAVRWYLRDNRRAAAGFVREVERVLTRIGTQPDWYGWYDDEFREAVLRKYPFSVVYKVTASGSVLVAAVAHASREPGYWQYRV